MPEFQQNTGSYWIRNGQMVKPGCNHINPNEWEVRNLSDSLSLKTVQRAAYCKGCGKFMGYVVDQGVKQPPKRQAEKATASGGFLKE